MAHGAYAFHTVRASIAYSSPTNSNAHAEPHVSYAIPMTRRCISPHLHVVCVYTRCSTSLGLLLLLILNQLHIVFRHLIILLDKELQYVLAQISLDCDFLATARNLGHT